MRKEGQRFPGWVPEHYWTRSGDELLKLLGATTAGLDSGEAARRLAAVGPNTIAANSHDSALALLRHQFASPLVLILLAGAAVSMLLRD